MCRHDTVCARKLRVRSRSPAVPESAKALKCITVLGCQLETHFPLKPVQGVQLSVYLDPNHPMRVDLSMVRWVRNGRAGIEFIRMVGDDQLQLRFHVGHIENRPRPSATWGGTPMCVCY